MNILINYEETLTVRIKYVFMTFTLFPQPPKNKKKKRIFQRLRKKSSSQENKDIPKTQSTKDKKSFSELTNEISKKKLIKASKTFFKIVISFLKKVFHSTLIKNLDLRIYISSDDAAKTALIFSGVASIINPLFLAVKNSDNCEHSSLDLKPIFSREKSYFSCNCNFAIKPLSILLCVIPLLINTIKLIYDIKNS